jgi:hypothetical protein
MQQRIPNLLLAADNFGARKVNIVLEHAQVYACCRDVDSYSPSRKHCIRRPTQRNIRLTTLQDSTFQTGSTHAAKTAPPARERWYDPSTMATFASN